MIEELKVQQVSTSKDDLLDGGLFVIQIFEEYLTVKCKSRWMKFDEDLGMKKELQYDYITLINRKSITNIEFGYSNERGLYEVTMFANDTVTIVFPSKPEGKTFLDKIINWKYSKTSSG